MIQVYQASSIITMNPSQPTATHIAVKEGRILAVGDLKVMQELGDIQVDNRFADYCLMPGFVEGHSHALEGAMWEYPYLGYFPRRDPEGRHWPGAQSLEAVQAQLREQAAELPPGQPLIAWG